MNQNLLTKLLQRLDEPAGRHAHLDAYYAGVQPLAFLSPQAREAIGDRFGRMATNLPRLAVTSLAERLRVKGFSRADLWDDWLANDLDQMSGVAHREALTLGSSFLLVWATDGRPTVSVESARRVAVLRDPGTRTIIAGVKRWETDTTTEAILYEPDQITRLRSDQPGATINGYKTVEVLDNPLGRPPVVELANRDRLNKHTVSELDDLIPLVDGLNKLLADLQVSSEFFARPRRWATGVELEDDEHGNAVNPFPESDRMMTTESEQARFGQLPPGEVSSYVGAVDVLIGQIMAVSALPAHYVGVLKDQPASADALRAAEASLTARAESKQAIFGRGWEDAARLMVAARDGVDPDRVDVRIQWADASTRSVAQEADAVTKLYSAGLLPASYALRRLGYDDHEIDEIRTARRADQIDQVDLSGVLA